MENLGKVSACLTIDYAPDLVQPLDSRNSKGLSFRPHVDITFAFHVLTF